MKIKIGQTLFLPSGASMVVKEIGDTYFITKDLTQITRKFKTSTMREIHKHPITAYTNIEELEKDLERKLLLRELGLFPQDVRKYTNDELMKRLSEPRRIFTKSKHK